LLRDAVIAQLRYCVELLNDRCSEEVRTDLFSAVGFFAHTAGFMAFDAGVRDDAKRMFRFSLGCAEESGDWHLRARALSSMGKQAIRYGDPDTALTSVELAMVRDERLTATERAILHTLRAHTLGKLGRVQEAARDPERLFGEISMLAVDPDAQNRGVGTALTEFATVWLRSSGMRVAMVGTGGDVGHAPARRIYEKAGYTLMPIARYFKAL
jgi:GNAT superfamily N-acetyltransferase